MPRTSLLHRPLRYILLTLLFLPMKPPGALFAQETTPNVLGQPLLDSSGEIRDDAFIRIPLRPEDLKYADLEGTHLKWLLLKIDAISREDRDRENLFWGRNIGTWGHEATQDWIEEYFRNSGLIDVRREQFDLAPQWMPEGWNISFASEGEDFSLGSPRPPQGAASIPPGGLEFDLVWIGLGSEADYLGRDVTGKMALIPHTPRPGTLRHSISTEGSVARALEHVATAVGIVYGISDNFAVWQRTGGGPGFNVRRP